MILTYLQLQKIFPEINRARILPSRIVSALVKRNIEFHTVPHLEELGTCVTLAGQEYVFLTDAISGLLYHETLAYEAIHAFSHVPAPFLRWRHNLESHVMSLVFMMPLAELRRLNKIKGHLDAESYELLKKRNEANERWKL